MLDFIKNNKFEFITIALWLIIVSIVGFNHEFFRDEVLPFFDLRTLSTNIVIKDIIAQGHAFLWHLIQFPLAKLNLPISSIQIIPIISVFTGIIYFLFKAPFNKWTKLAVIFSMPFLYYFPIIVRPYALIPICLFLLAELYKKREEHPYLYIVLIILLSQTHTLMAGSVCIGLTFFFVIENFNKTRREKEIKFLFPPIILVVYFTLFTLLYYLNLSSLWEYKYLTTFNLFKDAKDYLPFFTQMINVLGITGFFKEITFYILFSSIFIYLFIRNKKIFFISSYSICFLLIVYNKIFQGGVLQQKISLIFLIILFSFWAMKRIEKKEHILITSFFVLSFLYQIPNYSILIEDLRNDFSDSKTICNFLKKNNYTNVAVLEADAGHILPICEYCRHYNFTGYDSFENISSSSKIFIISQKTLLETSVPDNYNLIFRNKKHSWKNKILKSSPSKVDKLIVYEIKPKEE